MNFMDSQKQDDTLIGYKSYSNMAATDQFSNKKTEVAGAKDIMVLDTYFAEKPNSAIGETASIVN